MSELQVESSMSARRAILFRKLAAVLPQMPERFMAGQLYDAAGINWKNPAQRLLLASILGSSLHCTRVKNGSNWIWRKPEEAAE
jgi:hypothetical protein